MFGKSEYNSLKAQYDATVTSLSAAEIRITALNDEIDGYKNTIEDFDTNTKSMKSKYELEIETLKQKLILTEKSVNSKVNSALASVGVNNFAVESIYNTATLSPQEVMTKFMTLTGEAKTEFYREHKDVIAQVLSSNKINA